jgi:RND family efflux transporter MFP subunit
LQRLRLERGDGPAPTAHRAPRRWPLLVAFLGGAAAAAAALGVRPDALRSVMATPVETAFVVRERADAAAALRKESGWVEVPDERYPRAITALTTGRLEWVRLAPGQRVEVGQEVARVYEPYLAAERDRAEGELAVARQALALLEAGFRSQEVDEAKAALAHAEGELAARRAAHVRARAVVREREAEREIAALTLARQEELLGGDVASPQDRDEARARFDAAEARLAQSRAEVTAAEAAIAVAEAARDITRARLALRLEGYRREEVEAARAEVARREAEAALARLSFENRVIRSAFAGVVLRQAKREGDMVAYSGKGDGPTAVVATLYDPADLQARIQVDLDRIAGVREGQAVLLTTDVEGPEHAYHGEVLRLDPEADFRNNIVWVKVRILDPSPRLRPEMVCRAQFLAGEEPAAGAREGRLLAPKAAVIERGGRAFVYVVREGRAHVTAVEAGAVVGEQRVITAGLAGGEEVVTAGHEGLADGSAVRRTGKAP